MSLFAQPIFLTAAIALIPVMFPSGPSAAAECTAMSGSQRVAVLELYTSEGCDSCPAADRWLSALPKSLRSDRLVPLAYHVDYWNYIGWVDPYAQARFSDRQRQHSARRRATFVYTPQFLLNGADYRRGMLSDDIESKVSAINRSKPLADIKLTLANPGTALTATADVSGRNSAAAGAQLFMALFENNLRSAVKAGENKGRTLNHDFVVRELAGPLPLDAGGNGRHQHTFPIDPRWKGQDLQLAAFVQHPHTGEVWQALTAGCR